MEKIFWQHCSSNCCMWNSVLAVFPFKVLVPIILTWCDNARFIQNFTEQPKSYTIKSHITKNQLQELTELGIELRSLHVWKRYINALLNCKHRCGSQHLKTWAKGVYKEIIATCKVNVKLHKPEFIFCCFTEAWVKVCKLSRKLLSSNAQGKFNPEHLKTCLPEGNSSNYCTISSRTTLIKEIYILTLCEAINHIYIKL